ncbi:hypothetical protein [Janthinobacterium sp. PSPC3-1]|uniref:hypothetical protein n=1 Tax=Janthinobacterium sp. PSPC3-1 TaxID=2804653 RepID=UPI003CE9F4D1
MSESKTSQGTKNKANIIAVIGASGTGKSSFIKGELLRSYSRLLVWSPLEKSDKYGSFCQGVVVTGKISELVAQVKAGAKAIVYVPTGKDSEVKIQFDRFCRIVWELENATVLVEELSRVTMPSWSPPAWRNLSTAGRHQGLTIIGTSQRPANIDKDFLGNCTQLRCYGLNYDGDAKVMADALGLQITYEPGAGGKPVAIKPHRLLRDLPNFHFFHKNPDKTVRQGVNKSL